MIARHCNHVHPDDPGTFPPRCGLAWGHQDDHGARINHGQTVAKWLRWPNPTPDVEPPPGSLFEEAS